MTGTVTILHFCGEHIRVQTKCPMFGRGNPLLPTQESLPIWHETTLKSISYCRHTFCCHYRTWSCWKHHLEILLDLSQRMKQNQKIFFHQTWNEKKKKGIELEYNVGCYLKMRLLILLTSWLSQGLSARYHTRLTPSWGYLFGYAQSLLTAYVITTVLKGKTSLLSLF